jgi:hypothetical protein
VKKIAIASAAMGGAALIAFGASGTFAAFSDTDLVSGQKAGATTFEIEVAGQYVTSEQAPLELAPGGSLRYAYEITNNSDLPGLLDATISVTDAENDRNDPEIEAGDITAAGEFSSFALVEAFYGGDDAENCDIDSTVSLGGPVAFGQIAQTVSNNFKNRSFAPGDTHCVVLEVSLPTHAANINRVQGDTATFAISFTLTQQVTPVRVNGGSLPSQPTSSAPDTI